MTGKFLSKIGFKEMTKRFRIIITKVINFQIMKRKEEQKEDFIKDKIEAKFILIKGRRY